MDILWHPEIGHCSWCEDEDECIRGHSDGKKYMTYCFPCWDAQQEGTIVGSEEWDEDIAYIFFSNSEKRKQEPSAPFPS